MRMLRRRVNGSSSTRVNVGRDESVGALNRIKVQVTSPITINTDEEGGTDGGLLRSHTRKIRERRSRSQPLFHQNVKALESENEDENHPQSSHLSRVIRHSIDSEGYGSGKDGTYSSNSIHSNNSVRTTSTVSSGIVDDACLMQAEAVWDHVPTLAEELPFVVGDLVTVIDSNPTCPKYNGFWYGMAKDVTGWFPSSYVRVKSGSECLKYIDYGGEQDDFPQAMRYQRRKIIEELLKTEKDYVRLLQNIVFGYVDQCRRRCEMFSRERIAKVFGNIEHICLLHCKLLKELESCIDHKQPENSCISKAFLINWRNFTIYSEYCNNRPVSCAELLILQQTNQYHQFFEACRLLRGMTNLPLEGFLLTPVQKICRYPLQLLELLKSTPASHPDKQNLEQAYNSMRSVTIHINDAQRRIDEIQKVITWQRNVIGFRGPDLIENNHRILKSGEMQVRAITHGDVKWNKAVNVFLFDQSIVICKKDLLKKGALIFKERMSMQNVKVQELPDAKSVIGSSHKNSISLASLNREYILTCPDLETKKAWLEAAKAKIEPHPPNETERRLALISLVY
uniref:DH domain-containing protein n=1 Tax=Rhabditophanes sp. KR3021 TaxID=114890 RepID=A0AC35U3A2_9BILA